MRKKILLFCFVIICSFIFDQATKNVYSNNAGAVPARTGSPGDLGLTCAISGCHPSPATARVGLITSNIPVTGYIAGTTYTVTATVSSPTLVKFGFEISPQDVAGTLLGSLTITDPTRMHFTGLGLKYLTHTLVGTTATNHTCVWQFNWKAPAEGTGDVTFYGAFNFTNNNNAITGDTIHTSTLTIPEGTVGISDPIVIASLNVYPNPMEGQLKLTYYLQQPETVEINLLDATGRQFMQLFNRKQDGGKQNFTVDVEGKISPGIYLVQLKTGKESIVRKLLKL